MKSNAQESIPQAAILEQPVAGFRRATGDVQRLRRCLSCGDRFDSAGWSNRLCPKCRKRTDPMGR